MKAGTPLNNDLAGNGAAAAGLVLLHADDSLLVLDKPAGLLAVPGRGEGKQDCLSARVQAVYPDALVVHRLDQATSGLMLMARGAAMQRALSLAFEGREVGKRYLAVVEGTLASPRPPDGDDGWGLLAPWWPVVWARCWWLRPGSGCFRRCRGGTRWSTTSPTLGGRRREISANKAVARKRRPAD